MGLLSVNFQLLNYTMNTFSYENKGIELYVPTEKYLSHIKQKQNILEQCYSMILFLYMFITVLNFILFLVFFIV